MQIQLPLLGKFEFGRPQLYAALMLVALAAQAAVLATRQPAIEILRAQLVTHTSAAGSTSPLIPPDSILLFRAEQVSLFSGRWFQLLIPHQR